jgi:hypothetical protein
VFLPQQKLIEFVLRQVRAGAEVSASVLWRQVWSEVLEAQALLLLLKRVRQGAEFAPPPLV